MNYKSHFINSEAGRFTITDDQHNTIISLAIYNKFYTLEIGCDKTSHHNLFLAPFPPTAASFKEPMTPCSPSEVYEKRLQIWCDETEEGHNEKRVQARDAIVSAQVNQNDMLTLEDCHLTSLPPLIAPLRTLISRGNPLGCFDAPFPATLQEFDAQGIECLPKIFHPEFRTLKVVSSRALKEDDLDYLAVRAKNLEYLTVIGCDRKRLPYDLPTTLKFLHFADNSHLTDDALDDLADKLPELEKLVIEGNALKRLPRNLPPSLKELIVKNNQIEVIPDNIKDLFPKLTLLDIENNKLTKPPAMGASLSGLPKVELRGNPIPNSTPPDDNRIAELEKQLAHMKNLFTKVLTDKSVGEERSHRLLVDSQKESKARQDETDERYDRTVAELIKLHEKDKQQLKEKCIEYNQQYKEQCEIEKEKFMSECYQKVMDYKTQCENYKKLCEIEKEQFMKQYGAETNKISEEAQAIVTRAQAIVTSGSEVIEQTLRQAPLPRNSRSNHTTIKRSQTTATVDKMKINPTQPQNRGWNSSTKITRA